MLVRDPEALVPLVAAFQQRAEAENCRYAELRPTICLGGYATAFRNDQMFFLHRLDLSPSLDRLFHQFHRDCVQRKIKRAGREGLDFEAGTTRPVIDAFYRLVARTHRRHGVPVQPLEWFHNLATRGSDSVKVHLALKDGAPIAGVLMLRFKNTMTYKYGASDERFHATGAMMEVLWRAIQEAKGLGCDQLDLGRSDVDNPGLATFKDHWAASRWPLCYWRYSIRSRVAHRPGRFALRQKMWTYGPERLFEAAGRLLYRHAG